MRRGASSPVTGALLGLLLERPGYGYELAQRLNERMGPSWKLTPSSIYSVLERLEADQLVRRTVKEMPGRQRQRERIMFHPTDGASTAFEEWLARPARKEPISMQLENRLDNPIGSLSGGQRQALTLLMASWIKPKLLLLDEHTAALDPRSADQVIQLSEEIVSRDRLTTLMVTHSMQQATHLGDRLVMMHRGELLHDFGGAEKRRLRASDLLARFEDIRRSDQLDESAAAMLRRLYV